ncbi:MAG: hypothetical protein ACLQT6_04160, partial [Desulfomonilaceae bacterium]
ALIVLGNSLALAADRGTLVREAILYLSPDTTSSKLAQIERGRELILLDKSPKWLHVEALLGASLTPDPAFIFDDEQQVKDRIITEPGKNSNAKSIEKCSLGIVGMGS